MSGAPEDLWEKIPQETRVLDERISAEQVVGDDGALEGKEENPQWRSGETQLLQGVRSTRWQQLGLEAPKRHSRHTATNTLTPTL